MTRTIAHRDLRNDSSQILRDVKAGETFTITNHGEAVAMLVPVGPIPVTRTVRRGRFSELKSITLDHPVQQTLDELRGER